MIPQFILNTAQLFAFLLLPFFYIYSPTSASTKFQSLLLLSCFATYFYFPASRDFVSSIKAFIAENPFKALLLIVVIATSLKYIQNKLRFSRINALKTKYGYTDDSATWKNMTVEEVPFDSTAKAVYNKEKYLLGLF